MIDLRPIRVSAVRELCEQFHGYGSAGASATYAFGVFEDETLVAAYAWQPPPPGAAKATCPEAPAGVLALARMVAVPKAARALKHVSKPLKLQMKRAIDRTRWPVLITYSDEGQGHTGYTYQCSGWSKSTKSTRPFFLNADGRRASSYSNGRHGERGLIRGGSTTLQKWEHWACARGEADVWMAQHRWVKSPLPGRVWRSGNQAFEYVRLP